MEKSVLENRTRDYVVISRSLVPKPQESLCAHRIIHHARQDTMAANDMHIYFGVYVAHCEGISTQSAQFS